MSCFQLQQQRAACLIEPLTHRPIFCQMERGCLVPVFFQQPLRGIVWLMRQHGRIPQKKRPLLLHRLVHEIRNRLHRLAANFQPRISMPSAMIDIPIRHPVREAPIRIISRPPFAGLETQIPLLPQLRRQARLREHEIVQLLQLRTKGRVLVSIHARAFWPRRLIAGDFCLMRILSRQQTRQRRTAQAGTNIPAPKHQTLPRQLIQMWRPDLRMPHESIVRPRLVIADDKDNIRPGSLRQQRPMDQNQKQQQGINFLHPTA